MRHAHFYNYIVGLFFFLATSETVIAQATKRICASDEVLKEQIRQNPDLIESLERIELHTQKFASQSHLSTRSSVITIPVVVHVVYRTFNMVENITDEQIISQLNVLNKDYRHLNEDRVFTPSAFNTVAGDCEIEFKLAKRTPDAKPTTGIVRYPSARRIPWGKNDDIKMVDKGGVAPWDASKYLNIYVCAIGSGILGYSTMPGTTPEMDGVVIDYRYFGTMGTVIAPFHKGRTATHEIGHWLNLRHTWGDSDCGDDSVSDTPTQEGPNYGCCTFPHISCGDQKIGDMFMNFMDYSDDECMNVFSNGQKARIQALFSAGGAKASFLNSDALIAPVEACPAPINLTTSSITTKGVTLKWSAVAGVSEYIVEFRPTDSNQWLAYNVKNMTSATFTSLISDKTYECRVKSVCPNNQSAYSGIINFTTQGYAVNESCVDLFEPNNSFSTAKAAPVNSSFNAILDANSDNDYFIFKTSENQKDIRITLSNLPYDYDVRLYNMNQKLVASSTQYDRTDDKIIVNDAPVGYYYVRIYANGKSSATQCYKLNIELSGTNFTKEQSIVSNIKMTQSLKVAPNPAKEFLNVEFETSFEGDAQVQLFDFTGRNILQAIQNVSKDVNQFQVNVNNVKDGMYLLSIKCEQKIITQKVFIQNNL